jgi:large subunit ribosomal protein L29
MKANDIRAKSEVELNEELLNLHREQFNLKMQKATGQLAKPDQIKKNRRTIARIHTILAQKGAQA